MRSVFFFLLLLCVAPSSSWAVDVAASVDPPVGRAGEEMQLSVVVTGAARNVQQPDLSELERNFRVYGSSTSRSVSIVNGRTTSSFTIRYTIVPIKEGSFTIPRLKVIHDGTEYYTDAIPVRVDAAGTPPPVAQGDETQSVVGGDRDLFVRATVDKSDPYLFEQVTYRFFFYHRVPLIDNPNLTAPSTQGFWKEDIPARSSYEETIDGIRYNVSEVVYALFPTTPGELTIGEANLVATQSVRRKRDRFSVFGDVYSGKKRVLSTEPIKINVKRLPENAPPGFKGAVGDYVISARVDKATVNQGDPLTLRLTVSGNGNIETVGDVELPNLTDFRTYSQSKESSSTPRGNSISGRLSQEIVLVPLSAGAKTIPPIPLVTFSPRTGTYKTLQTRPIALNVIPGTGEVVAGLEAESRGGIEVVGNDIRFIETEVPSFASISQGTRSALWWFSLLPVSGLAYGGLWVAERRRRRLGSDVALRRRSKAAKAARKALNAAREESQLEARASQVALALRGYLADRWNVQAAGLTGDDIAARLGESSIDGTDLVSLLERCDAAQFAPGAVGSADDLHQQALTWVDTLEDQL